MPFGNIPKGWKVFTIGDVIELAYGKALKEEIRQLGKIPVYGSNGQVGWHNKKLVDVPGK
ncbi:MAG: restriction endonuclease subunit S [Candidatus Brocadiales bacterium]|nr:restriction endonuclease subunit S [Candidatus Brocadiales bacterium]